MEQNKAQVPAKRPGKIDLSGVIDPKKVKTGLFVMSVICLAICVVVSILAIWDYVGNHSAFKMIASSGVLIAGASLFELLNKKFG